MSQAASRRSLRVRSRSASLAVLLGCGVASLVSHAAGAQVVERNLPPPATNAAPAITAPAGAPAVNDDQPIGPALAAIVALGPTDPVRATAANGLDLASVARLNTFAVRAKLQPFLGRPVSRKLIAEVEAAIARLYRQAGFPFVSVTTPEQEITSGVLQLRVIEFRAGRVAATGIRRTPPGYIEGRVRLKTGQPIAADQLSEDLGWLNRNPFRQVGAVFSPGNALGQSDLSLPVTETRPWRVYGGYASSGSSSSGRDRYLLGAQAAGLPWLPDALASYQFTGAADAFTGLHPSYVSHAVRLGAPFAPRQALELTYDHVESNQPVRDFVVRQITDEASLGYRAALSTVIPPAFAQLPGDVTLGVEARQSSRRVFFGGTDVQHATIDVLQAFAGYSGAFTDRLGGASLTFTLHVSPGGVNGRNTDAAFAAYTNGASDHAGYAYLNGQASRYTKLPFGLALSNEAIFQVGGDALPQTEQIAIGAPSLVRGYSLDDGAFDSALILRNTVQGPSFRLLPARLGIADALQPRLFLDAGYGHSRALHVDVTAVSVGLGADYRLASALQLSGDAACALHAAPFTRSGDCRIEGRLTLSY